MDFNFRTIQGTGLECILPAAFTNSLEIIYLLCTYDPEERPSARKALHHKYFHNIRYVKIVLNFYFSNLIFNIKILMYAWAILFISKIILMKG